MPTPNSTQRCLFACLCLCVSFWHSARALAQVDVCSTRHKPTNPRPRRCGATRPRSGMPSRRARITFTPTGTGCVCRRACACERGGWREGWEAGGVCEGIKGGERVRARARGRAHTLVRVTVYGCACLPVRVRVCVLCVACILCRGSASSWTSAPPSRVRNAPVLNLLAHPFIPCPPLRTFALCVLQVAALCPQSSRGGRWRAIVRTHSHVERRAGLGLGREGGREVNRWVVQPAWPSLLCFFPLPYARLHPQRQKRTLPLTLPLQTKRTSQTCRSACRLGPTSLQPGCLRASVGMLGPWHQGRGSRGRVGSREATAS